ncbi:hypothetical protein KKA95_02215 [Patescibacteria group bacterium]|nr:hypothetical protein [Patescibacteria group bacterium]
MITNKKRVLFNKKGDWSASKLGGLLLVILVIVVITFGVITKLGASGRQARGLYDSGDCDGDTAWNSIDKCPCLSTLGLESNELRGCPLGTSLEEANLDHQTCSWFMSDLQTCGGRSSGTCFVDTTDDDRIYLSSCEEDNEENCREKEDGDYKKRCDRVSEIAIGVTEEQEGLSGFWDLTVKKISVYDYEDNLQTTVENNIDGSVLFDLENRELSQEMKIQFEIKNLGEQTTTKPFFIAIEVCNEDKDESSCHEILSEEFEPLEALESRESEKLEVTIGTNGDACDGAGDTRCFVKVKVDSERDLAELDENNNKVWFFVRLINKQAEEVNWVKYKSIEIFANEGEGSEYQGIVLTTCQGFMGGGEGNDPEISPNCDTEDDDCDDEGETLTELPPLGCLVHASEDNDIFESDCGWAQARKASGLTHRSYQEIDIVGGVQITDGDNVGDLFTYHWQAKPEGSLLCGDDQHWYLCDGGSRSGKVLTIGERRFTCGSDFSWSEII